MFEFYRKLLERKMASVNKNAICFLGYRVLSSLLYKRGNMDHREKFMLQLEDIRRHLEYDRFPEALESIKSVLGLYTPAEIYENFDIEVAHFLGLLCDNSPIDLKHKISAGINVLIKDHKNKNLQIPPNWFLDLIELSLTRFPPSEDPRDIQHLRQLIANSSASIELKLSLAIRLIQDSIDRNNEEGFRESLFIFKTLSPIFNKKAERQARFRVHFPKDPESLFNTIRVWAILQYSEYLQIHNRLSEVIDFLKSQINEPWFARSQETDKTAIRSELSLLEKQARYGDIIGSKYEDRIKQWIAVLIGIPFFVSMMGGILAGNHLQYSELVRLVVVIALSTALIMGIVLLSLGCDKKQKKSLFFAIISITLILSAFIAQAFSEQLSQSTPPLSKDTDKSLGNKDETTGQNLTTKAIQPTIFQESITSSK